MPPPSRCAVGDVRLKATNTSDGPLAQRLAELRTLALLKQSPKIVPLAQALVQDADPVADPALALEARYLLGGAQLDMGDQVAAEHTLEETYWSAVRAGLDDLAARAALDRTSATAGGPAVEATLTWARHAEAAVLRAGGDPQLLGKLEGILAQVEQARGDFAAARAHFERALELFTRAGAAAQGDLGSVHANYAGALRRAGDERAAQEHHEQALALFEEHWGSDHPNTHSVRLNLATLLAAHGEEARAGLAGPGPRRARAGARRRPPVARGRVGHLGGLEYAHGRYGAARAAFARAYQLALTTYGPADERTLPPLFNLGNTAHASGDLAAARHFFEQVLAARIALRGPEHPELVRCWTALASVAIDQRRFDAARESLDRALTVQQAAFGPQHIETAWIRVRQAELAEATGVLEEARERYLEAVAIARASTDAERPETGLILHALALLERSMRLDADAHRDAEAALAILSRFHDAHEPRLAELRQWLAELPPPPAATNTPPPR
nr:tetratricopeptide repeat protein [Nannocystis pusilla]